MEIVVYYLVPFIVWILVAQFTQILSIVQTMVKATARSDLRLLINEAGNVHDQASITKDSLVMCVIKDAVEDRCAICGRRWTDDFFVLNLECAASTTRIVLTRLFVVDGIFVFDAIRRSLCTRCIRCSYWHSTCRQTFCEFDLELSIQNRHTRSRSQIKEMATSPRMQPQ